MRWPVVRRRTAPTARQRPLRPAARTPGETGGPPGTDAAGQAGEDGDDGWETSTELPGVPGGEGAGTTVADEGDEALGEDGELLAAGADGDEEPGADGEDESGAGGEDESGAGGDQTAAAAGDESGESGTGDEALARALEDFDGKILDERLAAGDQSGLPRPGLGNAAGAQSTVAGGVPNERGTSTSGGGTMPRRGAVASAVPPPPTTPMPLPPDTPDAKDDDVVARQIREAAMAATDPEMRAKLWEEYENYKSGL